MFDHLSFNDIENDADRYVEDQKLSAELAQEITDWYASLLHVPEVDAELLF